MFSSVPQILNWAQGLPQKYKTDRPLLLVSGCSFTVSKANLLFASAWPGMIYDRCKFTQCFDYARPGAGNEYIGDSIMHHLASVPDGELNQYLVIIMWSGIDRHENKIYNSDLPEKEYPKLGTTSYQRSGPSINKSADSKISFDKIFQVKKFLESRNIPFVFTFYSNVLFPPYIPKRDTTHHFDDTLDKEELVKIRSLPWIPSKPMDFMFEYGFRNDLLANDLFHPSYKCAEKWTDEVLLTEMHNRKLIEKYD